MKLKDSVYFKEKIEFIRVSFKFIKGFYKSNKKNGLGCILYLKSKSFCISNFVDDKQEGISLMIEDNKSEHLANFTKGKMTTKDLFLDKNSETYIKLKDFFENYYIKKDIKSVEITKDYYNLDKNFEDSLYK